ncbi:MAG: ATP synthase subunit I [Desulfobacula sp.]|nr:ATP synthase subunit I [Desulfobacula sp.]
MQNIHKVVDFVTITNWLLLLSGGIIGMMMASGKFTLGIILGGLIVAINFHLLKSTLKQMFDPEFILNRGRSLIFNIIVKYYIRFAVSAIIIYLLLSKQIVHPLGLVTGLSVVVASVFIATAFELTRSFFKEAV